MFGHRLPGCFVLLALQMIHVFAESQLLKRSRCEFVLLK